MHSEVTELGNAGSVEIAKVARSDRGFLLSFQSVDWSGLVQTLQSPAILEWVAYAHADFTLREDSDYSIACGRVVSFFVDHYRNGILPGDPYGRLDLKNVLWLQKGRHRLFLRLRAKVSLAFDCKIEQMKTCEATVEDVKVPDVISGTLASPHGSVLIYNDCTVNLVASHIVSKGPVQAKFARSISISSHQRMWLPLNLTASSKLACPLQLDLLVKFEALNLQATSKQPFRCRDYSAQSFSITFVDADGFVANAAVIAPLGLDASNSRAPSGRFPIILTLHGTGVAPSDQADSHKRQLQGGEWVFGVAGAFVVAADRFGAHNWENIGARSAVMAVDGVSQLSASWVHQADRERVLVMGHSMGGHGAWVVALRMADRVMGVVALASWIRKGMW